MIKSWGFKFLYYRCCFYLNTSMREDKYYPWYPLVAEYSGGSKREQIKDDIYFH